MVFVLAGPLFIQQCFGLSPLIELNLKGFFCRIERLIREGVTTFSEHIEQVISFRDLIFGPSSFC